MARVWNGLETGSNGTGITTGNSGGSGATAFDTISTSDAANNTATYSNAREHAGSLGALFNVTTTGQVYTQYSTSIGTQSTIYGRVYYEVDAIPASAFRPLRVTNGGSVIASIQQNANGKLALYDSTNTLKATSTTTIAADTQYRLEWKVICNASTGTITLRIYTSVDSETAAEEVTTSAANTGTQMTQYQAGIPIGSGTALAVYMDDIAWDTADWLGPTVKALSKASVGVAVASGAVTVTTGGSAAIDLAGSAIGVGLSLGNLGVATANSGSGVPDFAALFGDPIIRLGTQADNTTQNNGLRDAASGERTAAAGWWHHMHGEGGNFALGTGSPTLADKMTDLGVVVSEYRNGSYIPQSNNPPGETQYIEADPYALGISVFWPGRYGNGPNEDTTGTAGRHTLAANLTSTGTTVQVRTVTNGVNNAPSQSVPSRLTGVTPAYNASTWPYWQSTGTGLNGSSGTTRSIDFAGTWVVQQVNQGTNLSMIQAALAMQGCVGYKPRIPWRDGSQLSVSLEPTQGNYNDTYLNQQLAIATNAGKMMVPRFMAGKYTPSWAMGVSPINYNGVDVPRPFNPSGGAPNATFIAEWTNLVQHLFSWARAANAAAGKVVVPAIDLGWFGADYSENWFNALVRDLGTNDDSTNAGYYVDACEQLILAAYDTGAADGSDDLAACWGLSGNGNIMIDYASLGGKCIAERQAEIILSAAGGGSYPIIAGINANGWNPNGNEWGQAASPEAQLDAAVWPIDLHAGLQDIYGQTGPRTAAHWITMFDQARNGTGISPQPRSVYNEIYAPGFVIGSTAMNSADQAALNELQNQMQLHLAYFQTTGTNAASANTANAVSWIRVDDEIMHITSAPTFNSNTGVTSFTVRRGLWGTTPTSHASASKVFAPVYVGAVQGTDAADNPLWGNPYLGNTAKPIRYAIQVGSSTGADWIADRIEATFTGGVGTSWKGYSAIWYDVSGPNRYNQGDAWAWNTESWDFQTAAPVTNTTWGQRQRYKFERHRARGWINDDGDSILFYENGAGQNYSAWKSTGLDTAVDVGLSEKWCDYYRQAAGSTTTTAPISYTDGDVTTLFDVMATGRSMLFWLRWNRDPVWTNIDAGKRYGYGLYMMAWRVGSTSELMGPFNAARGSLPAGGTQIMNNHSGSIYTSPNAIPPDDLFRWNFGAPVQNVTSISALQVGTQAGFFRRDFANGTILLNMTATAKSVDLGSTNFWNVMVLDGSGDPTKIGSRNVTVAPYDAMFLLTGSTQATVVSLSGNAVGVAVASGTATKVARLSGALVGAAVATGDMSATVGLIGTAKGVAVMWNSQQDVPLIDEETLYVVGVAVVSGTLGGGRTALDGDAVGVAVAEAGLRINRRRKIRRDRKLPAP